MMGYFRTGYVKVNECPAGLEIEKKLLWKCEDSSDSSLNPKIGPAGANNRRKAIVKIQGNQLDPTFYLWMNSYKWSNSQ